MSDFPNKFHKDPPSSFFNQSCLQVNKVIFYQKMRKSDFDEKWELIRETYIFKKFEKYNPGMH